MNDRAFADELPLYRTVRQDLDRRLRNLGLAALVASALPVGLGNEGALYLWQVLPILRPAETVRMLAPAFLGAGLCLLGLLRPPTRFGLGAMALGLLVVAMGLFTRSKLAYTELFSGVLSFVGQQPVPVVLGLVLVAVGADLRLREESRRLSRAFLHGGAFVLGLLYALPHRGTVFAVRLAESMAAVVGQGDLRAVLGTGAYFLFDLFPLGIGLWAFLAARRRGRPGILSSMARFGLAGLTALMCYRMLTASFGLPGVLVQLRAALLLAVVVGVASRSVEAMVLEVVELREAAGEGGPRPRRKLALGGIGLALLLVLLLRSIRPAPDLRWDLGPAGRGDRELLGDLLPRYVHALGRRNLEVGVAGGGGEAAAELRDQASELLAAARDVDPSLAVAIEDLIAATSAVDLHGRLWVDAVVPLNRRIRALGLPHVLDAWAMRVEVGGRARRLFFLAAYGVERIRRFRWEGREYAALHVRRIDRLGTEGSRLGFVREDEPFALVVVDAIAGFAVERLHEIRDSGRCGFSDDAVDPALQEADAACGRALRARIRARGLDLGPPGSGDPLLDAVVRAQVAATEVHEIQHQVAGDDIHIPAELYRLIPIARDIQLARVAHELSAYLSELSAGDDLSAIWVLAQLSGFLAADHGSQSPYRYAGGLVVGALLGEPVIGSMGRVDTAALLRFWLQVERRGPEAADWIAARAAAGHKALLGASPARPICYPVASPAPLRRPSGAPPAPLQ